MGGAESTKKKDETPLCQVKSCLTEKNDKKAAKKRSSPNVQPLSTTSKSVIESAGSDSEEDSSTIEKKKTISICTDRTFKSNRRESRSSTDSHKENDMRIANKKRNSLPSCTSTNGEKQRPIGRPRKRQVKSSNIDEPCRKRSNSMKISSQLPSDSLSSERKSSTASIRDCNTMMDKPSKGKGSVDVKRRTSVTVSKVIKAAGPTNEKQTEFQVYKTRVHKLHANERMNQVPAEGAKYALRHPPVESVTKMERRPTKDIWLEYVEAGNGSVEMEENKEEDVNDEEKGKAIERIELAIKSNAKQIMTLEYFHYEDPLSPGSSKPIIVNTYLLGFSGKNLVAKDHIGSSQVPILHSKLVADDNIIFLPITKEMEQKADRLYVIMKAEVETPLDDSRRRVKCLNVGDNEESKPATTTKLLYGVKQVATLKNQALELVYGCTSAYLICPMELNDKIDFNLRDERWIQNYDYVEKMDHVLTARSKGAAAHINYEISDEHVDFDWEEIEQNMIQREKKKVEEEVKKDSENILVRFVFLTKATVTIKREKADGNGRKKKVTTPIFEKELSTVSGYISPFDSNHQVNSIDELLQFLNENYRGLLFKLRNEEKMKNGQTVFTIVTASSGKLPRFGLEPQINSIDISAYNDKYLNGYHSPFAPPYFERRNDYNLNCGCEGEVIMNNLSPLYDLITKRISDYLDDSRKEKQFMILWNRFIITFRRNPVGRDVRLRLIDGFIEQFGEAVTKLGLRPHMVVMIDQFMRSSEDLYPDDVMGLINKMMAL